MKKAYIIIGVIALIVCVAAIFISPTVDLQPTALRALQWANMLLSVMTLALLPVVMPGMLQWRPVLQGTEPDPVFWDSVGLVDELCTCIC